MDLVIKNSKALENDYYQQSYAINQTKPKEKNPAAENYEQMVFGHAGDDVVLDVNPINNPLADPNRLAAFKQEMESSVEIEADTQNYSDSANTQEDVIIPESNDISSTSEEYAETSAASVSFEEDTSYEPHILGSGSSAEDTGYEPHILGSGSSESTGYEPHILGSGSSEGKGYEPHILGSGSSEGTGYEPHILGSGSSEDTGYKPHILGSGSSEDTGYKPHILGSGSSEGKGYEPHILGSGSKSGGEQKGEYKPDILGSADKAADNKYAAVSHNKPDKPDIEVVIKTTTVETVKKPKIVQMKSNADNISDILKNDSEHHEKAVRHAAPKKAHRVNHHKKSNKHLKVSSKNSIADQIERSLERASKQKKGTSMEDLQRYVRKSDKNNIYDIEDINNGQMKNDIEDYVPKHDAEDVNCQCPTCKNRRFVDRSNDLGVSFKSPQKMSGAQAVMAAKEHERQHLTAEYARAFQEGKKVVSQSITIYTRRCGDCGNVYVSGGVTKTVSKLRADVAYRKAMDNVEKRRESLRISMS